MCTQAGHTQLSKQVLKRNLGRSVPGLRSIASNVSEVHEDARKGCRQSRLEKQLSRVLVRTDGFR